MKKVLLGIVLILAAMVSFPQEKLVPVSDESVVRSFSVPPVNAPNNPPVGPSGILVWNQDPECIGFFSSEIISSSGWETLAADDFILDPGQTITSVAWWFGIFNQYEPISEWHFTLYDDINCFPGNIIQQWTIPFEASHEQYYCTRGSGYPDFYYWADLTPVINALPGVRYWLSIQAGDHNFPGQRGWDRKSSSQGCDAAFKSANLGQPDWIPAGMTYLGYPIDFAFQLYGSAPTPLSGYAIFIAIGLIAAMIIIRFLRIRI